MEQDLEKIKLLTKDCYQEVNNMCSILTTRETFLTTKS